MKERMMEKTNSPRDAGLRGEFNIWMKIWSGLHDEGYVYVSQKHGYCAAFPPSILPLLCQENSNLHGAVRAYTWSQPPLKRESNEKENWSLFYRFD